MSRDKWKRLATHKVKEHTLKKLNEARSRLKSCNVKLNTLKEKMAAKRLAEEPVEEHVAQDLAELVAEGAR